MQFFDDSVGCWMEDGINGGFGISGIWDELI